MQYDKYVIEQVDQTEFKSVFVTVFKNYDEEFKTCDGLERGWKNINIVLNNLSKYNKYDIDYSLVKLYKDRTHTAREFHIPKRTVTQLECESDREYGEYSEVITDRYGNAYGVSSLLCRVSVLRMYLIEHYCMDGREVWLYDRNGAKAQSEQSRFAGAKIYFANGKQVMDTINRKIKYDGCANMVTIFRDPRQYEDIITYLWGINQWVKVILKEK